MSLEARDVTFRYRKKRGAAVLRNVSLTLEPGERVGLSAPSGRGKTTLCRLLAGYEKPGRGEILLDGKPLDSFRGCCPVQMIWQHPEQALDPLLRLGASLSEAGRTEASLLERLHIESGWLERYPLELSGGELQRFCIARVLRSEVRYLLCDEITAMLDLITQAQIWEMLLAEARARGLGLLIISHDRALLDRLCTRIVELDGISQPEQ